MQQRGRIEPGVVLDAALGGHNGDGLFDGRRAGNGVVGVHEGGIHRLGVDVDAVGQHESLSPDPLPDGIPLRSQRRTRPG